MATNLHRPSCKVPVMRIGYRRNLNFVNSFSKKILKYKISCTCEEEWEPSYLMRTDKRTDRYAEVFANAPKNSTINVLQKAGH